MNAVSIEPIRAATQLPLVRDIVAEAARLMDVSAQDVIGPRIFANLVAARALAVWSARLMRPGMSYPQIARFLGNRDHTTLINLHRKAVALRSTSPEFNELCTRMVLHFGRIV